MKLLKYKVTNFRSVENSGWIDADEVTALIGVNESGKTNLLLPLWKLKPAQEGEIKPTSDYPKKKFAEIRANPEKFTFITCKFDVGDLAKEISELTGAAEQDVRIATVSKRFDNKRVITFSDDKPVTKYETDKLVKLLEEKSTNLLVLEELKSEVGISKKIKDSIDQAKENLKDESYIIASELEAAANSFRDAIPAAPLKSSVVVSWTENLASELETIAQTLKRPAASEFQEAQDLVWSNVPKFVYYSNYGNLDSEIYLPHVVENLERADLGTKEAAKARTLRVLFDFVTLSPAEILELGQETDDPTNDEIEEVAEKKRERSILLQSAGTTLTKKFQEWWKQGDYRFRFEADGSHFRIWVSDDRRPEEIELENRSTGLQWFLSFYLIFLVESGGSHNSAVLLLDEPGLSLHPLAQRDLSEFFESLSKSNVIIYTTHSPFLIDADKLDRARKVFVNENGETEASSDLRKVPKGATDSGAAYAVHSALNMSVAESFLIGCKPVVVEGPSDQRYLNGIKSMLIGEGLIAPKRELVFMPGGGAKTTRAVASMITGKDEELPLVLLDSDEPGDRLANSLKSSLYSSEKEKVRQVGEFTGGTNHEIEDLLPFEFMVSVIDRWQRRADTFFEDVADPKLPIIDQIENWAKDQGISLELGWKVELSNVAKSQMLKAGPSQFSKTNKDRWQKVFEWMIEDRT